MSIESLAYLGGAGNPQPKKVVEPGRTASIFTDYSQGIEFPFEIVVECVEHDLGGNVFRISKYLLEQRKRGISADMYKQGYIGSIATLGAFPPLEIVTKQSQEGVLLLNHASKDYFIDKITGRVQQHSRD
jgi:hypothetical protein